MASGEPVALAYVGPEMEDVPRRWKGEEALEWGGEVAGGGAGGVGLVVPTDMAGRTGFKRTKPGHAHTTAYQVSIAFPVDQHHDKKCLCAERSPERGLEAVSEDSGERGEGEAEFESEGATRHVREPRAPDPTTPPAERGAVLRDTQVR